jgi:hypothetical protein
MGKAAAAQATSAGPAFPARTAQAVSVAGGRAGGAAVVFGPFPPPVGTGARSGKKAWTAATTLTGRKAPRWDRATMGVADQETPKLGAEAFVVVQRGMMKSEGMSRVLSLSSFSPLAPRAHTHTLSSLSCFLTWPLGLHIDDAFDFTCRFVQSRPPYDKTPCVV